MHPLTAAACDHYWKWLSQVVSVWHRRPPCYTGFLERVPLHPRHINAEALCLADDLPEGNVVVIQILHTKFFDPVRRDSTASNQ